MTQVLFRRCDGLEAGAPVVLPKGRPLLSAVVKKHADRSRPHIVSVCRRKHPLAVTDMSVRLRRDWSRTRLSKHDTVIIVYLPQGGGAAGGGGGRGKGMSIGLIVGAIALAAVGQFWGVAALNGALGLGATSAIGSTIWAAGTTALLAGGAYLLNKATQAKADKTDDRPTYGVSGGGNQPRSGDRIPVIYGRCWNSPDLSQPDYTIYDGDDQILYKRLTLSCGRCVIKSIRVSGVTMWTANGGLTPPFSGADIELIQPGATSALVPGSVISVAAVGSNQLPKVADFPNYAGPFDFGSDAPLQSKIQLDFSLPQGCYAIPKSGKFEGKQFPVEWGVLFEYASCDTNGNIIGSWAELHRETNYVLSTRPIRATRIKDVPAGRYAVRARNIGPADEVDHSSGEFRADVTNVIMWEGLRSHHAETIVRPGVTELAMRIRSGKALGVTSYGDVEVEVSRILPVWYGAVTGWVEEETDKAVWASIDALHNADYGANVAYSEIDLDRFKFYADNVTQYDRFSAVIRGPVSVYDAASTILGAMRASPLRLGNIWTMVRDEPKSVRKYVISRRQILKDSSGQTFNLDLSDGSSDVIVEWNVGGDPKRRREKRITFGTQTLNPKRMAATGITDGAHAIHIATWAAASAYYRRERRSLTTELAGRLFMPNDRVIIDNWYFDGYQAAGVVDREGYVLTVDADMALPPSPYVVLRARDGKEWGPVAVTQVGNQLTLNAADVAQAETQTGISLANVINKQTQAFTTVLGGKLTEVQDAWLVRAISFSGDTQVGIEAVYDAPGVWSALAEPIIVPPPPPSSGLENDASVTVAYVRGKAVQRNGAMFMDWAVGRSTGAAQYAVRISYDDWATTEDVFRGPESSGTHPLREYEGTIRIRARGIAASGLLGPEVESAFSVAPALFDLSNATPGSLQYKAFLEGMEPVGIVDDLPALFGYQGPKVVTLINGEGKRVMYQLSEDSTTWQPLSAQDYVANTITAAAIQAGAVKASAIDVDYLSAITADLGDITAGSLNINGRFMVDAAGTVTIRNATTGARLVITNTLLQVYDASNVLRVRLGIW